MPDLLLGGVWIRLAQTAGRHNHSGRTVPTLQAMAFPETFLYRVEPAIGRHALDGRDFTAVGLRRKNGAGLDRLAVQERRAGAADGRFAADVCPGQSRQVT